MADITIEEAQKTLADQKLQFAKLEAAFNECLMREFYSEPLQDAVERLAAIRQSITTLVGKAQVDTAFAVDDYLEEKEPQALPVKHKDDFAKIFRHPSGKQILVMKDMNDEGCPAIKFMVEPADFGVCSSIISYSDNDEGWDFRDKRFIEIDEQESIERASMILSFLAATVDES